MGSCGPTPLKDYTGCISNSMKSRDAIVIFYMYEVVTQEDAVKCSEALDQIMFYLRGQFSMKEIEKEILDNHLQNYKIKPDTFASIHLKMNKYRYCKMIVLNQVESNSEMYQVCFKWRVEGEPTIRQIIWESSEIGLADVDYLIEEPWRFFVRKKCSTGNYNSYKRNYPEGKKCSGCDGSRKCKRNCLKWKQFGGYREQ